QPQSVALTRLELRHGARQIRAPLALLRSIRTDCGSRILVVFPQLLVLAAAPPAVANQVCRYTEQIVPPMILTFETTANSQEPVVGFLQKVVGKLRIPSLSPKVDP